MNNFIRGIGATLAIVGIAGAAWWILRGKPVETKSTSSSAPATVTKEDQLTTITLKPDSEKLLGIATAPITKQAMPRTRTYGGEVVIPAGQTVLVASPFNGTLRTPSQGLPKPGSRIKKGEPIFSLLPLLTPEGRANLFSARVEAEGQVKSTQTLMDAADVARKRARGASLAGTGNKQMVEAAQEKYDLAVQALESARDRVAMLKELTGQADKGTAAPMTIVAPQDGILRNISAANEQVVPTGAPLFEVFDPSTVWIRVPVFVGDLPEIDAASPAIIGNLTGRPGSSTTQAKPVLAPPSANAATGTVDIFFELDNRATHYSPGERVGVTLQLKDEDNGKSLTIPWSAVIHDINGGTWVYESVGNHAYVRRRVVVRSVIVPADARADAGVKDPHKPPAIAVLASGPPEKTSVVIAGAAELFGTETGFSK